MSAKLRKLNASAITQNATELSSFSGKKFLLLGIAIPELTGIENSAEVYLRKIVSADWLRI
jgi:hypothetical protein